MKEFRLINCDLRQEQNQRCHKTKGLSSSTLVLRRGQPFTVTITYDGQKIDPLQKQINFTIVPDPGHVEFPVTVSRQPSPTQLTTVVESSVKSTTGFYTLSLSLSSPASASIAVYTLQMQVKDKYSLGQLTLLCNPWCPADSVFLESEDLRTEYIRNDFGLLFQGSHESVVSVPWLFAQYEKGILDICMKLLQLSPQHQADTCKDLQNRSNPVYISRVISAMVNSNDDKGVLMGRWSDDYSGGVDPKTWFSSADILRKWAETQFEPVKYGQCWVFGAVMCTVMRALGIPTRVITTFDSAHDASRDMVIHEYYNEMGEKLFSKDSVWDYHVWVESWMKRPDLGQEYDGWQALDPTPQERSEGIFRCGPASVKAVYEKKEVAQYDVPFIYAAVNAEVHKEIVRMENNQRKTLSTTIQENRVGSLIVTKRPGSITPGPNTWVDITSQYKLVLDLFRSSSTVDGGFRVSLQLLKSIFGENITFKVEITNNEDAPKLLRKHVNAQNKKYNSNPTETFWEAHDDVEIDPFETVTVEHEIPFKDYMLKQAAVDALVNLAVVVEDVKSEEKVLASEEFYICSPSLDIEIQNDVSNNTQVAWVTFTNPFSDAVSGKLTVSGSRLLKNVQMSIVIQPQETMRKPVHFTPLKKGAKMLTAFLALENPPIVLHGYKIITASSFL